jgi:hypothetical protein
LAVSAIDVEPAIDAKLRLHPADGWYRAWRTPMPAIKSDAAALSLAFLRSIRDRFSQPNDTQKDGPGLHRGQSF